MDIEIATADAQPTKSFFVSMVTRDITLGDCILDLLDNSVDEAWKREGSQRMGLGPTPDLSAYEVEIGASPDRFTIRDNCGGMSLQDAEHYAFTFGRKSGDVHDAFSVGVYGIGMKRSIFKLGRSIRIRSTILADDSTPTAFFVPIDVDAWLVDDTPPWDFKILKDTPLERAGVQIEVERLNKSAVAAFGNPIFLGDLHRTIARDYALHLARGLKIKLNGKSIEGVPIRLLENDRFTPVRIAYTDDAEEGSVDVEIIAGMAEFPPMSTDPGDDDRTDQWMGWYVACNGRIVLAADRTATSGWGTDDWPMWHRQYSGFVGIVLFTSDDALALPLTTTKRSVDTASDLWLRARSRMRKISKDWIAYTNQRKQALDEARSLELSAKPVPLDQIRLQAAATFPQLAPRASEKVGNVNYAVPISRLKKLASGLGNINMNYRDIGIKSFEYTFDDFVGKE